MSDNPFSEPEDTDRTIIRPVPGGRPRPAADTSAPTPTPTPTPTPAGPPPDSAAPRRAPPRVAEGTENIAIGADRLAAAAAPLLQLMARLRNTASPPDTGDLRERTVRQVRAFEQQARDSGVPMEMLRPAHYALCASLDDVVLNTPWGSSGSWNTQSLVSTFHQEVRSGERFFDLLRQMCDNPGKFLPVIELMYLCMSLGFIGRYRLSPRGASEIERVREETYAVITRQRPAAAPELAPHTKGLDAPYRPARVRVPLWVAASAGLAIVAGLFFWFSTSLNAASDALYARMLAAPPAGMPQISRAAAVQPLPPPPPALEPTVFDRLHQFLQPEITQGLVAIVGPPARPVIRIANRGMFPSGSASVEPSFKPLLERIGLALKSEPGSVQVIGYTDNQPIRTVAFPSNFQLSTARAKAAESIIASTIGDAAKLRSEGRGDASPIAPNTTPEGREQNRRIEINLLAQGT